jgi:hypothetical protein
MSRRDVPATVRFGRFLLDLHRHELLADGVAVRIGSRALDALIVLTEANGDLVTKDELIATSSRPFPAAAIVSLRTSQHPLTQVLPRSRNATIDHLRQTLRRQPPASSAPRRYSPSSRTLSRHIGLPLWPAAVPARPDRAWSFGSVCCRNSPTARGSPPWGHCPTLSLSCPPLRPCLG